MWDTILRLAVCVSLAIIALVCGHLATELAPHDWTRGYAACVSEDSQGPCFWDAVNRGNGRGHSFVITPDQKVIVVPGR